MVIRFWVIFISSLIVGHTSIVYAEGSSDGQKVYSDVSSSIVTIYSINENDKKKIYLGSAVAIGEHLLATNCHVALAGNYLIVDVNNNSELGTLALQPSHLPDSLLLLKPA